MRPINAHILTRELAADQNASGFERHGRAVSTHAQVDLGRLAIWQPAVCNRHVVLNARFGSSLLDRAGHEDRGTSVRPCAT